MEPSPPRSSARALLGPGLFVAAAVVAANGLNAVFQIALARIIEPSEYSLLVALVVVTLIAAVPPLAFQAAVARQVAVALAHLTFAGTRLGAGLGIGLAGGGPAAVMGGVAAATALTLALTLLPLRGLWRAAARSGARRLATLPNAAAATGLTVLMALATVD